MSVCPLLSKSLNSGSLEAGSGSHSKGTYAIEIIEDEIAQLWMNCIGVNCQFWDATHSDCSFPTINKFTYHKHDSHDHNDPHGASEVPADLGAAVTAAAEQPKANLLTQEYSSGEDTDGNSEVFGKDFTLDLNDEDIPRMLLNILNDPNFPRGLTVYTWQDYLDTLP